MTTFTDCISCHGTGTFIGGDAIHECPRCALRTRFEARPAPRDLSDDNSSWRGRRDAAIQAGRESAVGHLPLTGKSRPDIQEEEK